MLTDKGITFSRVVVATGRTDLRKGIDGLSAQIRLQYGLDPLEEGTLFLFCGTRKDRIKGLLWCSDRFILLYIRLSNGHFQWPRNRDEARKLTKDEFIRLMDGYSIDSGIQKKTASTGS